MFIPANITAGIPGIFDMCDRVSGYARSRVNGDGADPWKAMPII